MIGLRSVALGWILLSAIAASAQEEQVLSLAPETQDDWVFLNNAQLKPNRLVLYGRTEQSTAFFHRQQWSNLNLTTDFRMDATPTGVLAFGVIFRATSAQSYYYLHFDRTQAILVRSTPSGNWNEVRRISGLNRPAGRWNRVRVRAAGDKIRAFLNGRMLFEVAGIAQDGGCIGFYANQGVARIRRIAITGEAKPADFEFKEEPRVMRYLTKDAGAGGYEAFPDICRLQDGRLACAFYAGHGHVSLPTQEYPLGGRIVVCYSSDEGRSWSAPRVLYDGPGDDRDPSIRQLADGKLVCNFFTLNRASDQEAPLRLQGVFQVTSYDLGKTWSEPELIAARHACSSPVRQLRNGVVVLGIYAERKRQGVAYGGVLRSIDAAESWSAPVKIHSRGAYLDAETDVIQLRDGTLYAALRGGRGAQMHWSKSKDMGKQWTAAQPIGFPGHCPYLHRMPDGTIILAHRLPGTSLHFSRDECQTWSENVPIDAVSGAYPSLVNCKDGTTLVVYYGDGAQTDIRIKRFRMSSSGITWVAP